MKGPNAIRAEEAHKMVAEALHHYYGTDYQEPAVDKRKVISPSEYHAKLTETDIRDGVVVFLLLNRMLQGSGADVDLYSLVKAYLLDLDSRREINAILEKVKAR